MDSWFQSKLSHLSQGIIVVKVEYPPWEGYCPGVSVERMAVWDLKMDWVDFGRVLSPEEGWFVYDPRCNGEEMGAARCGLGSESPPESWMGKT
jgi:hypothetical protein